MMMNPYVNFSDRKGGNLEISVPKHVAIIMDGNGRWAQRQGLPRTDGHEEGARRVKEITTACRELGVKVLTLYSFSTENWKRPASEIAVLMDILRRYVISERPVMMNNGIRLKAIGQIDRLPVVVRLPLRALIKETKNNEDMILNLALSYGARQEILEACKQISSQVEKGVIGLEDITEELFQGYLYTKDQPDPDLIIRTSGEMRLSNFLLWQSAYSELYVVDKAWPDFKKEDLLTSFQYFSQRERRFGKTGSQMKEQK
jgi:undecaprenyl diphosphate synthase